MNLLARIALFLVLGLPALGNAQTADAPVLSSQATTPPPLVTVPPDSPPAVQEPAPPPFRGQLLPPQWQSARPNYFVPRLLAGTFLGTLAGAGGLVGGFLLGLQLEDSCDLFDDVCGTDKLIVQTIPALLGAGALSSLVVYGMGSALHGEGALPTTLLGGFAGTGLSVLLTFAIRSYNAILLIPPLSAVGALIAYEISDSDWEREQAKARLGSSGVQLAPVVSMTPGGGVLGGLVGRF